MLETAVFEGTINELQEGADMAKEYGELYGWGGKDEEWMLRT